MSVSLETLARVVLDLAYRDVVMGTKTTPRVDGLVDVGPDMGVECRGCGRRMWLRDCTTAHAPDCAVGKLEREVAA